MHTYRNFAKVRVAGSNPVFRSRSIRSSGTLSRVPVLFSRGWFAHHFGVSCHFRATPKSEVDEPASDHVGGMVVDGSNVERRRAGLERHGAGVAELHRAWTFFALDGDPVCPEVRQVSVDVKFGTGLVTASAPSALPPWNCVSLNGKQQCIQSQRKAAGAADMAVPNHEHRKVLICSPQRREHR